MLIKYKIILSFAAITSVIGVLAGLSYVHMLGEAEHVSQHEAEFIARTVARDITTHPQTGGPLWAETRPELQDLVMRVKKVSGRDVVVVDKDQKIIADAVPEEIGTIFNHDENDEVGKTIRDGRARTFIEVSSAYPQGIRSLAVPLDSDAGARVGALVLEYTPLYRELLEQTRENTVRFLGYFLAALAFSVAVGYVISRKISGPLGGMQAAVRRMAEGDLEARIEYRADDELGALAESFNHMTSERKKAEDRLKTALGEKELLLREIHHRVKNNMAIITSLLRLQARQIENREVLEIFKESQNRIRAMSLVHEKLYRAEGLLRIDLESYARDLIGDLFKSYGSGGRRVEGVLDVDDIDLDIDTIIPCGLIINELVTNSLKHAFSGVDEPVIRIAIKREGEGGVRLEVGDNGTGMPEAVDGTEGKSLGLQIVAGLVQQLKGRIEMDRTGGTTFRIYFRPAEKA